MTFREILPIVLVALAVGGAIFYLVRRKRKGAKCIGCPYCDSCPGACNGACSSLDEENKGLHK
jgi:hypothetical protein